MLEGREIVNLIEKIGGIEGLRTVSLDQGHTDAILLEEGGQPPFICPACLVAPERVTPDSSCKHIDREVWSLRLRVFTEVGVFATLGAPNSHMEIATRPFGIAKSVVDCAVEQGWTFRFAEFLGVESGYREISIAIEKAVYVYETGES